MTVGELRGRVSHQEFLEWQAFFVWEAKERKRLQEAEERKARTRRGR